MILVDASVWIEVFRAHRPLDLEAILDFDDVVTCLPVIQEVLQGFREERGHRLARHALFTLSRSWSLRSPRTCSRRRSTSTAAPGAAG